MPTLTAVPLLAALMLYVPPAKTSDPPRGPAHRTSGRWQGLVRLCTRSLLIYHAALTKWFTGEWHPSEFPGFLRNLSLSSTVSLQDPSGRVYDYGDLLQTLKMVHGREPVGQVHKVDLRTISVVDHKEHSVTVKFNEKILGTNGMLKSLIRTTAVCDRADAIASDPTSESGVVWRSFVETRIPMPTDAVRRER